MNVIIPCYKLEKFNVKDELQWFCFFESYDEVTKYLENRFHEDNTKNNYYTISYVNNSKSTVLFCTFPDK